MEKILFTSESVTEGHPDKMCDAISDAILDALMEKDPMSRVACETATTTGLVLVMGEITTNAYVDIQKIVRDTIREIGYTRGKYGFDADTCAVITAIDEQSADIALGVDKALEAKMGEDEIDAIGAGDQGIQFGYASNETEEYMPYAINMAHKLARQLTKIRKDGTLKYLRPDGKTQVTVEYDEAGKPSRIDAVVCSTQHDPDVTQEQIHEGLKGEQIFRPHTRSTGASSSSNSSSAIWAESSPAKLPRLTSSETMMALWVLETDCTIASQSSGTSVRRSSTSASIPCSASVLAASSEKLTSRLQVMMVMSLPSRLMSACPRGMVYSSSGICSLCA